MSTTITAALFNAVSHAIRLRAIGAGASTFADETWIYDSGVITSATDNGDGTVTLGDSTKTWTFAGGTLKRWTQATPGSNGIPAWDWGSYDLVIDPPNPDYSPDPRKVLQYAITAQPDATHVTLPLNPDARIVERRITAVSDLVGRNYRILRSNGQSWIRGYFDQPNDPAIVFGRAQGVAVDTMASTTTLTSTRSIDDVVAGNEVLYRDSGDVMRRKAVATVDYAARTLRWAGTSNPPVVEITPPLREFYVVAAGGVWIWGAQGGTGNTAYSGLRGAGYVGHAPDDTLGTANCPTLDYDFMYGSDPLSCPVSPTSTHIFNSPTDDGRDIDLYYPQDNACGTRDTYVNERVHKSVRAWWSDLMGIAVSYIPVNTNYSGATAIPNFTIATWLYAAGVNIHSATAGTHSGTTLPVTLGVPHTPITLWWTVVGADGSNLISGYEPAYNGTTINGAFSAAHDGKVVKASTGPRRPVPKRFGLMFDLTYFVPDLDGGGSPVVPPTEAHPGTFITRPASTHYRMSDDDHVTSDSVIPRHAITNGDYARYVGDNLDDPGFPVILPSDVAQPLAPFHSNAYVGTRATATQSAIDGSRGGTATGGSTVRIVDTSKDWLSVDFYDASNGLTHSGTATGGSETDLTDDTKAGTALWADARFPDFPGALVGFTVEVLFGGTWDTPTAVVEKRLITSSDPATGSVFWDEPMSVASGGNDYRIREPLVLNRWRSLNIPLVSGAADHSVTVHYPDGTSQTVAILGNHDDTLFVDTLSVAVTAGCSYSINDPEMSGVYHRVSGQWVTTAGAGADPRYTATSAVFRDLASANIEDTFTEYGLYRPNDTPFNEKMKTEICAAVNALDMIRIGGSWIDNAANNRDAGWHNESTYAKWLDGVTNGGASRTPPDASTSYYPYNGPNDRTGPPFAVWDAWVTGQYLPPTPSWQVTSGFVGDVRRQFNHFQVLLPDNVYAKSVAFYNFATLPATVAPPDTYNAATSDFDANGDRVAQDVWTQWSTGSGTTGTVTSAQLGSLTIPNAATAPSIAALPAATVPQSGTSTHILGYKVTNAVATISYGFPALSL